jgi:hypothetical protein
MTESESILPFYKKPWFRILTTVSAIISPPLAVFFYIESKEIQQLTYFVHPVRSTVFAANTDSNISVSYKENKIKSDLTVATVAFWNAGDKAIWKEDVLKPLTIRIEEGIPILEAIIKEESRKTVKIELDDSLKEKGVIRFSWKVLGKYDGAAVQIIYASDADRKIKVDAETLEQKKIDPILYPRKIDSPLEQYEKHRRERPFFYFSFVVLIALAWLTDRMGSGIGYLVNKASGNETMTGTVHYPVLAKILQSVIITVLFGYYMWREIDLFFIPFGI